MERILLAAALAGSLPAAATHRARAVESAPVPIEFVAQPAERRVELLGGAADDVIFGRMKASIWT